MIFVEYNRVTEITKGVFQMTQINCFYGVTAQHEANQWLEKNKEKYLIQDVKISGHDNMTKIIMIIYQTKEDENNAVLNVR